MLRIEPFELLIAYHNKRYTPTAHLVKPLLDFSRFPHIEIQKWNLVLLEPMFCMLAMRAALGGVDDDFCRLVFLAHNKY